MFSNRGVRHRKTFVHPGLRISVSFQPDAGGRLTICDSGNAMPKGVAARLFSAPVPSHSGLGVGLYQAAKQAEQLGYTLRLVDNVDGKVCFDLTGAGA